MLRGLLCAMAVCGCNCQAPIVPDAGGSGGGGGTAGGGAAGGREAIDAGDLLAECIMALGRPSSSLLGHLGNQCEARDFACVDYASCQELSAYVASRSCRDAGFVPCFPLATGTAVFGTTPLGAVDFRAAWGSPSWAFAHDLVLQLGNTPTAELAPAESLGIFTGIDARDAGYRSIARLVLDGGVAFAPVIVVLDGVDAGHAHGFITIDAPGWNVSGPFDAPMCPQLDRSGP